MNVNQQILPPTGDILALITSLSNASNHTLHTQALAARDQTLSSSPISYGQTCIQFGRVLSTKSPQQVPQEEISKWSNTDEVSFMQIRHDPVNGWNQLRQMAGLLLKNALCNPPYNKDTNTKMRLLPDAALELKVILCQGIVDENDAVRRVSSSIIASCTVGTNVMEGMEALPLSEWGNILTPFLVNCLDSAISIMQPNNASNTNNDGAMEDKIKYALLGSLMTLSKLLEDDARKFEKYSGPAFNKIAPCLLKLLSICGEERVKVDSLKCCVQMIEIMPGSLVAQMNDFLGVLSSLGNDRNPDVRRLVCRSIATLLSSRTEYLQEHILSIAQFMLTTTADSNEDVALESCEFWLTFASLDQSVCTTPMIQAIQSLFPQLIPTLVKCLVYPEEKIEELMERNAHDEQQGEDRAQDIAPVFHRSKAKGGGKEEDEEDDDDDDEDEFDKEWSLRTCAAASLDSLASVYPHDTLLPHLLPSLQESLAHDNPWVREAGILALGAISDGCGTPMATHMAQLYPYLIAQITSADSLPQSKSISCWTVGRYAFWALEQAASNVQPDLIQRTIEAILGGVLDKNRRVQISACSALCEIIEQCEEFTLPYLESIYNTLNRALEYHQTRALMVSLDVYGSIATAVGPGTGEGNLPSIYAPPLLAKWAQKAQINPMDRTLLPLMESFASITAVTGMSYQPWALETFDMAMSMINSCLMTLSCQSDYISDEEADPLVCATDVLDGLVEGLGSNFTELVSSSKQFGEHFLPTLKHLTGHEVDGVRMSAFALMGDVAKHCPVILQNGMAELLSEAILCIDPLHPSVCNNAVWAIGEICVKCIGNPTSLQPFAQEMVQSLISLLAESGYTGTPLDGLVENAASTMGRIAKVNVAFVSTDLPRFLNKWCDGCSKIFDLTERRDAFEGLMLAIQANPLSVTASTTSTVADNLTTILFAVVSWHVPSNNLSPSLLSGPYSFEPFPKEHIDLCEQIRVFLHNLKDLVGANEWKSIENSMPVNVRRLFREVYAFN